MTADKSKLSDLWKKEDWLAVWIGFILIIAAAVSVITGSFDFSAAKFETWGNGVSLLNQLNGALFVLAVIVRLISAEFTLNRYLEWAFWALIVGLVVSNTVGVPNWLRPAVQTEYYIKAGLVIMGFSVLFSNIVNFGLYGLGIAWIVTPIGGTVDSTRAVTVAGTVLGEKAQTVAVLVKSIQNILIGFIAFAVAVFFSTHVEKTADGKANVSASEIWYRLPKFIIGFFAASLIASFIFVPNVGSETVSAINKVLNQYKNWAFVLAFTSIGLDTNFREIKEQFQGGKPLILYVVGQLFNIVLTFLAVYLLLSGKFFPLPTLA